MVDTVKPQGDAGAIRHSLDPSIELSWRKRAQQTRSERETPFKLELPSGLHVMAIRAPLRWLYKHGRIPDHLTAEVERMIALIQTGDPKHVEEEIEKDYKSREAEDVFAEHLKVVNACWLACVVSPQFSDDDDREFAEEPPYHVDTVEYFDKAYLYKWAQGVDQSVEDFFLEQAEIVGALADGEGIQLSSEPDSRVDRFGRRVAGDPSGPSGVEIRDFYRSATRGDARGSSQEGIEATHDDGAQVPPEGDHVDDLRPAPRPKPTGGAKGRRRKDPARVD
jgi:hypothetical protein